MSSIADNCCRAWVEVDLGAIVANLRAMAARVAPCKLLAVIKGDAYGMGAHAVARAALDSGVVSQLGVASLEEALELADFPLPKHIISAVLPGEIPESVRQGFILPVVDLAEAAAISAEAVRQNRRACCELKIDTGMGRLGIPLAQAVETSVEIAKLPNLDIAGAFTHLACAGTPHDEFTLGQISGLVDLAAELRRRGVNVPNLHCAASDAIVNYAESFRAPFTMVRPGAAIYGACTSPDPALVLRPAVAFKGRLIAVKELPAGHSLGYSRLCRLQKRSRIGIISAGYCDGVKIPLTNRGYVLIGGAFRPVAGRVSMDYTTILLDGPDTPEIGAEAVFIGAQGDCRITVEEYARINGTVTQEIMCSFAPRVKRVYIK